MESRPRTLAWIGLSLGLLADAGIVICVAVARSIPQRAPTAGDYKAGCVLFIAWIVIGLTLLTGFACSLGELLSARKSGRSTALPWTGVILNAVPISLGLLYDVIVNRGA